MKYIWLSDLHFDFLSMLAAMEFLLSVAAEAPDGLFVTGDISISSLLQKHLVLISESLACPVYFTLGNHDYHLGSFRAVEGLVKEVQAANDNLIFLGGEEIVKLNSRTALVGHQGWGDGRAGLGLKSSMRLNDHRLISDFADLESDDLFAYLAKLGYESAAYFHEKASAALRGASHLIVLTHVPPFAESALYAGQPCDPEYTPHYVNLAAGAALRQVAAEHQASSIEVLCGHTHHQAYYRPRSNLTIKVAAAEYGRPAVAEVILLD